MTEFSITAHGVEDLAGKPYVEYRLTERDNGEFVAFHAFGSREFVEEAALARGVVLVGDDPE